MKRYACAGIIVALSLSACAPESGPLSGADEVVSEAAQPLTVSGVQTYSQSGGEAGSPTNGKKIIVAAGAVHAVYSVGGAVKYTRSTDGVTWSAPVNLDSTGATAPTIAADSQGRIGVAYIKQIGIYSYVYYLHKIGKGSWSAPGKVVNDSTTSQPSMVADGTTMHLTYVAAPFVRYLAFASGSPPSSAAPEYVTGPFGNVVYNDVYPSVAVSAGPGGSRRVRIAMLRKWDEPGAHLIGLWFTERLASNDFPELGSWLNTSVTNTGNGQAYSLSMDANPTTGDFYVAASFTSGSAAQTSLYHQNAFSSAPTSQSLLSTAASTVSMAAATQDCIDKMRVQWSPATFYGATQFRTATWGSGPSPTWIDAAPVALSSLGFASTSMLSSLVLPGTIQRRTFHSFHDIWNGGSSFSLQIGYDTATNPAPCN